MTDENKKKLAEEISMSVDDCAGCPEYSACNPYSNVGDFCVNVWYRHICELDKEEE